MRAAVAGMLREQGSFDFLTRGGSEPVIHPAFFGGWPSCGKSGTGNHKAGGG